MYRNILILLIVLISNFCFAQSKYQKAINAQIGYASSFPYYQSEEDFVNSGIFLQGEYVLKVKTWLEFKPYLGFTATTSNGEDLDGNPINEKSEVTALFLGTKLRLRAPIRWFAPYFEFGIGASIGNFETLTSVTDVNKSGIIQHIPFGFGVELGRNNNFDIGVLYLVQKPVEQVIGIAVIGVTFNI